MSGFQEIVLSAYAIDRIATPMIEIGGYMRVPLPDAPAEQFAAWHVPAGCDRIEQCLLVPPADDRGCLRVVVFHGVEQRPMRSSQHAWDSGGIFDIDIFSHDTRTAYRGLQKEGWTAFGDPADYVIGAFDVCEVVAIGPDGLVIALIEPHNEPLVAMPEYRLMSRVFNSTQIVRDFDAATAFYEDILGWQALMTATATGPGEPGPMLGLPMPQCQTLERRVGIFHPQGGNDGSIEILQVAGIDGRDFADLAVAPNIGLLSLRFPVNDAATYAAEIVGRGGALYTRPMVLDIAPIGRTISFSIRSPDGAILEFYTVI